MAGENNLFNDERRNFYRLEDQVYLEYRIADDEEIGLFKKQHDDDMHPDTAASQQLDYLSRQLSPLIASIRAESPAVAQYLDHLNRKVDVLAGLIYFDRFHGNMGREGFHVTNTVDISEGGIRFNSESCYEQGSHLLCRLIITGFQIGLETYGKVVYCEEIADQSSFRIGLEFPFIKDYERKLLTRYIFDRQRELIRQVHES